MFFGRAREVDVLFGLLREPQTRTLLLYGPPGVGKTSLLRAGLGPKLAQANAPCIFLTPAHFSARPVPEQLWREVNIAPPKDDEPPPTTLNRVAMAARSVVVVVDDLDQLGSGLLAPRTAEQLATFAQLVQRGDGRVRLILCAEDEDFWRLASLEGPAPGLLSGCARMQLSSMDEAQAAEAMERTVISGGNYLEAGLSAKIAHELAERGLIPPVIVQMIGAAAVSRRVTSQASYRREGGSRMLLDRFLLDPLAAVGPDAVSVFGVLAESAPNPVGREELPPRTQLMPERIAVALSKLQEVGLVRRVGAATGEHWTLIHRWLARRGREATAQARIEKRQTTALVRQKIEARKRLGLGELKAARRVYQSASPGLETTLVKHSTRFYVTIVVVAVAAVVAAIGGLAVTGSRSFHLALAQGGAGVPPGETQVVIDRGRPALGPLATGFERAQRLVNTGFYDRVLVEEGRARLLARAPGTGQPAEQTGWLTDIIASLRPFSQGLAALALGDPGGVRAIAELYAAGQYREQTLIALGFFGKGKGADEQKLISSALADASPVRRRRATRALLRLSKRVPGSQLGQLLSLQEKGDLGLRTELLEAAASELSTVDAEPLLSGALRDPSPELRARAVSILEARAEKEPQMVARLAVQVLGESNEKLRERISRLVVETVRRAPTTAGVELQRVAVDAKASEEVRIGAAEALIGLPDADAKPILGALAEKLAQDDSARLKALGLTLVGRLGPPDSAIEPLRTAAKESTSKEATLIRAGAAAGLFYLGPNLTDGGFNTLRNLTYDKEPKVREAAARALGGWRKDKDTIKVLKNLLYDPQAAVNKAAAEALGMVASFNPYGAVEALKTAISSNRTEVRVAAMRALDQVAKHYPSASLPGLVKGLKDSSPLVSAQAALSLGRVAEKDAESAVRFLPIAARDEDPVVRAAAAQAYGTVLSKKAALAQKPLQGFITDKDARVRRAAVRALLPELQKGGEAVAVLPKLLGDEDREIRTLARELLEQQHEKLDAKVVDEGLLTLLSHAEGADRVTVIRLAIKLGKSAVAERAAADPLPDVRLAAAEAGVPLAVEAAAGDPDARLRRAAVLGTQRLAETEPGRALPIVGALAYDDDERVARHAARVLAQLAQKGSGKTAEQALHTLEQLVRSPSERRRAAGARALGEAEGPLLEPAQKLLEPLLVDSGGDVRLEAILAYGRLTARAGRKAGQPVEAVRAIEACTEPSRRLASLVAAIEAGQDKKTAATLRPELERLSSRPCGRLEAHLARAALDSGGTAREALVLAASMFGWH
jgi:HEAT repeat protein